MSCSRSVQFLIVRAATLVKCFRGRRASGLSIKCHCNAPCKLAKCLSSSAPPMTSWWELLYWSRYIQSLIVRASTHVKCFRGRRASGLSIKCHCNAPCTVAKCLSSSAVCPPVCWSRSIQSLVVRASTLITKSRRSCIHLYTIITTTGHRGNSSSNN